MDTGPSATSPGKSDTTTLAVLITVVAIGLTLFATSPILVPLGLGVLVLLVRESGRTVASAGRLTRMAWALVAGGAATAVLIPIVSLSPAGRSVYEPIAFGWTMYTPLSEGFPSYPSHVLLAEWVTVGVWLLLAAAAYAGLKWRRAVSPSR